MKSFSYSGRRLVRLVAGSLALGLLAAGGVVSAEVGKGKTRPLTMHQFMEGLVKPQTDALKKGLIDGTVSADGWEDLAVSAALLNEASYTMMDDGRSPDKVWAEAAGKTMREGSVALLKALAAKDQAAAKVAFGATTKSCKGCHDVHKKKH